MTNPDNKELIINNNSTNESSNSPTPKKVWTYEDVLNYANNIKNKRVDYSKRKVSNSAFSDIRIDDINRMLKSPQNNTKLLRNVSNVFYNTSPAYKEMIQYITNLPTFAYEVLQADVTKKINKTKFEKDYLDTITYLEKLNLDYELRKAYLIAMKEDTFFGYEVDTEYSYFIIHLNADYCEITGQSSKGFEFQFDFSYFDVYTDILESYPEEFKQKYDQYKLTGKKWIRLDSMNSICFKINDELEYSLPPLSTTFQSIIDLDEYKAIKKARSKNDNFLALSHRIPVNDKGVDEFVVTPDTARFFNNVLDSLLPEGVTVLTTPLELEAIKTEKSKNDNDLVTEAYDNLFKDAGISQVLFNSGSSTSIGVNKSIIVDESMVFRFLKQIQKWINFKLINRKTNYKFKVKMLEVTYQNQKDKFDLALKSAQSSLPNIMMTQAILGVSPAQTISKINIEQDILGITDKLRPLSSSYTQSSDSSGAPPKDDNEISDNGAKSRDTEGNEKRE